MVIVCGPIVTLPVRAAATVLRPTMSVKVADRLPLALAGSAIHAADVEAVHAQPVSVSIVIATSPPTAGTAVFAGVTA
jgi:hypothetical protein